MVGLVRSIIRILAVLDIDPSLCLTVVSTCFVAECAVHSHSLCQQLCVLVGKAAALLRMINNNLDVKVSHIKALIQCVVYWLRMKSHCYCPTSTGLVFILVVQQKSNCNGYET